MALKNMKVGGHQLIREYQVQRRSPEEVKRFKRQERLLAAWAAHFITITFIATLVSRGVIPI